MSSRSTSPVGTASPEADELDEPGRIALLEVARRSVENGLRDARALVVDPSCYAAALGEQRATFVTLRKGGQLRGCIGTLEASAPLVVDVAENAYKAAFCDPRFEPLERDELPTLDIHLAVLSQLVSLQVRSERALLDAIRPGVDGLVLREGARRGTFLPAVWSQLPEPEDFLRELKRKAGLPTDRWSSQIEVERYTVESFP